MKHAKLTLLGVLALLFTGCVVTSVHPFYSIKDLQYKPELAGQWTNTDQAGEVWKFQPHGSNAYRLVYTSNGEQTTLLVHLFKLQNQSFLDMTSLESDCNISPPPIPSHFLLRVIQFTPTLKLAPFNNDWLKGLLAKEPKAIQHLILGEEPDDQRVVLTAPTPELQQFLTRHLPTEDAWKDPFQLKKEVSNSP